MKYKKMIFTTKNINSLGYIYGADKKGCTYCGRHFFPGDIVESIESPFDSQFFHYGHLIRYIKQEDKEYLLKKL